MILKSMHVSILLTITCAIGFAEDTKLISISPRPYMQGPRASTNALGEPDTRIEKSLKNYYKIMSDNQRKLPALNNKKWRTDNKISGGGGMDGGGGTIVKRHGLFAQDELLDLVNFPIQNPFPFPKFRLEPKKNGTCSLSPYTIPQELTDVLKQIFQPLIGLNKSSIAETDLISMAIENFRLILDSQNFSFQHLDVNAFVSENQQKLTLYPGAIYIQGRGLILSQPALARLSGVHQYGLLVHEILRQISIGYELYISDQDLQIMTSNLLEINHLDYQVEHDQDFLRSGLPIEMYLGPLTKYIIRHHINNICATYSATSEKTEVAESSLCQKFATFDIHQMYSLLPEMRDSLLKMYGFADSSEEKKNQIWKNLLLTSHQFLLMQARDYNREMPRSTLIKNVLNQDKECHDISHFLKEGN